MAQLVTMIQTVRVKERTELTLRPGFRSGGWQVGAGLETQGEVPQGAAVTPSPLLSTASPACCCAATLTSHTPLLSSPLVSLRERAGSHWWRAASGA